jgi:tetrahydromethanopterin S-methyltransferase subunit G
MVIMADPGTERRIDELSKRVDFGFEQTNHRIDELSKRMDFGFAQTNQRLTRVEDDVRALRTEMKDGFDGVNNRFDDVNNRFDDVNKRFDDFNKRFDGVNNRFDGVNGRFDGMNESVNARFDRFQHLMIGFFATTLGAIIAGVIANLILSHS